jgi:hypothetical protein
MSKMDSLRELVTYLKTQPTGASMGELKELFEDESLLKQYIKSGLNNDEIFTEGKKRGTRYYVKGIEPVKPEPKKESEVEEFADSLDHSELESILKSDKPVSGEGVFCNIMKFGKDDKDLVSFFKSGSVIEQNFVRYDKVKKKNVIGQKISRTVYNKMGIKQIGRKFIINKYNTHTESFEVETFDDYEDMREYLRILFSGEI